MKMYENAENVGKSAEKVENVEKSGLHGFVTPYGLKVARRRRGRPTLPRELCGFLSGHVCMYVCVCGCMYVCMFVMGKGSLTGVFWKFQKLRENYEFRDFWDPAEICRKLPENYKTAPKLRDNYVKKHISGNFQTFSVIFG